MEARTPPPRGRRARWAVVPHAAAVPPPPPPQPRRRSSRPSLRAAPQQLCPRESWKSCRELQSPHVHSQGGGGGARGVARVGRAVAAVGRQTPLPGGVAAVSAAGRRGAVAATAPLPVRIAHRAGWRDCQSGGAARTGKTSGRGWSWKLVENVEDAGLMGMGIAWAWRRAGASGRQEEPGR